MYDRLHKYFKQGVDTIRNVLAYIKPYYKRAFVGIGIKALGTVTDLALPFLLAYMIDRQLSVADYPGILRTGLVMLILAVLGLVTNIYSNYCAAVVSQNFARDLRNSLFSKATMFPLADADNFGIPSLINRINSDINNVQNIVLMMLRIVIRAPILFIGGIIMSFILDPVLSIVLILTTPILALVIWAGMKKIVPVYSNLQKALDKMILVMRENLQGLKVVRALSTGKTEEERFQQSSDSVKKEEVHSGRILAIINPGMTLVMNLGLVATVWFGGLRVSYGSMQTGGIVAFVNYFLMILNALLIITRILIAYTKAVVSANRIEEVLMYESKTSDENLLDKEFIPDNKNIDGDISLANKNIVSHNYNSPSSSNGNGIISGSVLVSFENVSFSYPNTTKEILRNITFQIKKGQTFAVIGSTGSGKTTIINLLLGLYYATSGSIWFDGNLVDLHNSYDLRKRMRVVFQDPMLFSQTIEDNLRWSKDPATSDEIQNALQIAQAQDFVGNFEEKEHYLLSQGGQNLSGGQRQRLAIARAILGDAELLIMDDSSSALDAITELNLRKAITDKLKNKTTLLIIAQRISSIKDADQILVLEEGSVDSIGTHRELLHSSSIYQEIVKSQGGEVS